MSSIQIAAVCPSSQLQNRRPSREPARPPFALTGRNLWYSPALEPPSSESSSGIHAALAPRLSSARGRLACQRVNLHPQPRETQEIS